MLLLIYVYGKKLNNENFKGHEFTTFENLAGEK